MAVVADGRAVLVRVGCASAFPAAPFARGVLPFAPVPPAPFVREAAGPVLSLIHIYHVIGKLGICNTFKSQICKVYRNDENN